MPKALFLSLPLHGHVNPSLPLVRELVGRGDEVVYFANDRFAARVAEAGARYQAYRDPYLSGLSTLPVRTEEIVWLLNETARRVLEGELDVFRAERPDYIITDSVAPWGQWTAKILGLPVVTSIPTLAVNRSVMRFGLKHGVRPKSVGRFLDKLRYMSRAWRIQRRLRRVHGVDGPGVMDSLMGHSGLNIVYTSRHFQPCAETFDDRFLFIGPMSSRAEAASAFPWDRLDASRGELSRGAASRGGEASRGAPAIVYISLGTIFNSDPAFYRACFEAFADADITVILSIGTNVSLDSLGAAPKNFVVAPQVPQLAVLQRASAFVTHGGMNSVSESLFYGVPMTVVPQMGEQAIIGRRVAQLGAGICLTNEEATAPRLRESVQRLLTDDSFRQQADAIRRSFVDAGGTPRAADAIRAFTR
jgi:UDP:flavonoid glycosyltransferase YjiC (YdhE family)